MLEKNCLNKETLNLFQKREVSDSQRDEIEIHLAECANCRQILLINVAENSNKEEKFKAPQNLIEKVKKLPEVENQITKQQEEKVLSNPWYKKPFLRFAFAPMLVLLVGILGGYFWQTGQNPILDEQFRDGSNGQAKIELISPANNALLKGSTVEFQWKQVAEVNSYVLIISDKNGDIVLEEKTKENKFSLEINKPAKPLSSGQYYFWYVRAKFIDGKVLETHLRKFTFEK